MFGFSEHELHLFRRLSTPRKIQDFLDSLPMNFSDDTCYSPRKVLEKKTAHCMEGAMLAAAALRFLGQKPLVMDLKAIGRDQDHVVTLFRDGNNWGAISKTNHGVLRYREPVYRSVREIAMSYFHEYYLDDGRKTLRSYSVPVDLSRFDMQNWMTSEEDLWDIPQAVDDARHFPMLTPHQIKNLRKADKIERTMAAMTEWKKRL
ncbi:hypothetical protein HZA45_01935 [Candidatus Peregrinibacteria bacterium]|nr:hypothetical protein [Candidatus Peregrinibacteria bacterium]